jgi:hypothetical protein
MSIWDTLGNVIGFGLFALVAYWILHEIIEIGYRIQKSNSAGAIAARYAGVVSILVAALYLAAGVASI